ncbi:FAD binding domain-containing protein [Paenibacillus sediminis]|uniref:Xanthine dehydrogenase molybdenum-binding subunit n=1 Tax=Paenibacillus sediminis TaxID=664909 RepID=A0ABS4H3J2_9BACL|nr:FAD binding domain-containing protein [Paenibacillus sediminis]MBP1937011.1 xanthine dehydrogenase molybdenum-binding subunit [Paenibacillus sediminis]
MIPFNFEYYEPSTIQEAVHLFKVLDDQGKHPLYYSGGTEIITLGRINEIYTGAVIDIKNIPECSTLAIHNEKLILGCALTLSELHDSGLFPLLGETGAGVADRTSRNKITLGGNICSQIIYREAVLPLLLTDSEVRIAGPGGMQQVPINQIFNQKLQLRKGELFVQSITDTSYIHMPYTAVKKRKVSAIDYPLVTIAAIRTNSMIRLAFSGVCSFPFRSQMIEEIINRHQIPLQSRVEEAVNHLPAPILDDIKGSAAYREFVFKNTLFDTIRLVGGG